VTDTAIKHARRDHYEGPRTDKDSARVTDEAVTSLGKLRIPLRWHGDGGAELQLLASLQAEIDRRLPKAVALARDQKYSWAEIGDLVGTTRAAAWQRFAHRCKDIQVDMRRSPLTEPD
jgi:hypothetical protein